MWSPAHVAACDHRLRPVGHLEGLRIALTWLLTICSARLSTRHLAERIRLFISEVGFVPGRIVRQSGHFVAVRFELAESVERDLLIRKLFTSGYDIADVSVSTWSATIAMLKSIWLTRAELPVQSISAAPASSTTSVQAAITTEKLQSESLMVRPRAPQQSIAKLVEQRRAIAAWAHSQVSATQE
jgi:hypothetical protein